MATVGGFVLVGLGLTVVLLASIVGQRDRQSGKQLNALTLSGILLGFGLGTVLIVAGYVLIP